MITTGAVDEDLIEQFKTDMEAFDCVSHVSRNHGRSVNVKVQKNENGVPYPQKELGEIKDGNIVTDDYAISRLAGSGHAPGDKYTHCLAVSPLCSECGEKPQKGLDEDDDRCSDCSFGDNLLSAEPGTTAVVEAGEEVYGVRHEEGEQFEATADEDGFLRDDDDRVMNNGRYSIVEIVDSPTDDDEDDDDDPEVMTDGGTEIQKDEDDTTYPLPVDEQTPLSELVKIRWDQRQESHTRMLHSLQASFDDASESEPLIGVAYRCLQRQKTQTVVRTREEAESLHYELQQYLDPYGIPAPQGTEDTFRRVLDALEEQLREQGYKINTDQHRPEIYRPE